MKGKKVVILHNQVTADSPKDELDVLVQVDAVFKALCRTGLSAGDRPLFPGRGKNHQRHQKTESAFCLQPGGIGRRQRPADPPGAGASRPSRPALHRQQPGSHLCHFQQNLEQEIAAAGRSRHSPPWLWAGNAEVPAGDGGAGMRGPTCSNRYGSTLPTGSTKVPSSTSATRWSCAPCWRRRTRTAAASFSPKVISRAANSTWPSWPATFLPVSEIHFVEYPDDKLNIVDFRAKWEEDSFEYTHTPRIFDFPDADRPCWQSCAPSPAAAGIFSICAAMPGSISGWTATTAPGCWKSMPIPAFLPTAAFMPPPSRTNLSFTEVVEKIIADCLSVADERSRWLEE